MQVTCPHCQQVFDLPVSSPVEIIDAMGQAVGKMMFPQAQPNQELVVEDTEEPMVEEVYDPWIEVEKDIVSSNGTEDVETPEIH